jgi:hypothetical protein
LNRNLWQIAQNGIAGCLYGGEDKESDAIKIGGAILADLK